VVKNMTDYRKTKLYKKLDLFTACSIAEGFCEGENASEQDRLTAWQWLLDTGQCWVLQGFYGRTVTALLEEKSIQPPLKTHTDYYGNIIRGTAD
jgi:hypothetical protein